MLSTGPRLAPTPRDTVLRDGTASLYHFRRPGTPADGPVPLLLVPSMINRWYVLDLREGASLAHAAVQQGFDTWCLDWGIPEDEDRDLEWAEILARLHRMVRRVKRETGSPKVAILGYCMGATLSGIYAALHPGEVAAFVNLAGPFDFSEGGLLRTLVDEEWFDAETIASAGNVGAQQMQQGFVALRPTMQVGKWVGFADRMTDEKAREAFFALETWAGDNIPFPAAAYRTYITELYQQNLLVQGQHHVGGRRVDLAAITCPVLTVVAERDTICPPPAALALNRLCKATTKESITVPGGHVGAVVGGKAERVLYPAITGWLRRTQ